MATEIRSSVVERNTISSVVPFLVAVAAGKAGADPAVVYGSPLSAPPRADDHVEVKGYFELWSRAMTSLADPAFALRAARAFQLEDHELFGFLAMSCATLGQAYEKTAAYRALYCVGARWDLKLEAEAVRLIWQPWPGDLRDAGYRAAMDFAVADMADDIQRLAQASPKPIAVHLRHAAPEDTSGYVAHYGVEPQFVSSRYELVYAPGLPDLPIVTFNSRLRDYFEEECKKLIARLPTENSIVGPLRKLLIQSMDGGDVSIESAAKQLGLSSRSLQRRLSDEGTRYNDVLNEVRAEFAKRYLARGGVSASEVAYLIGFTEPPAFFKAFKRWTGMTPREFQHSPAR